jgi:DNA-binding response OmpR family regulator
MAPIRVLVVDDEPSVHKLLHRLLQSEEYLLSDAYDGKEALEEIAKEKPDLILLDLMMPKLSGMEVCQQVKSDPKTKDIIIIFLSARGSLEDQNQGLKMGADDYVSKPFRIGVLMSKIKDLLEQRSSSA